MIDATRQTARVGLTAWLYALTILIGAFLVFQVQPIISKSILPWFGGSPAVWTTCMLFFQVLLFGGYAYAHFLSRQRPVGQAVIHMSLILTALLLLPIKPEETWKARNNGDPTLTILLLLATTVGLPYFLLSSTGPLVQSWFSRAFPAGAPYRLYALSNAASLAALVTYPFLVEPAMSTGTQSAMWSLGFALFALCCGYCVVRLRGGASGADEPAPAGGAEERPSWRRCAGWIFLAALASTMLLATTNHVCQDVAVIPFLWVAPLALYLVSFIICFDKEAWYSRAVYGWGTMLSVITISVLVLFKLLPTLAVEIGIYFVALFSICMVCHGELVRRKPEPRYLTLFYLMCSAGGAVGGIVVALVCPYLFSGYFELNLGLVIAYLLAAVVAFSAAGPAGQPAAWRGRRAMVGVFVGLVVVLRAQAFAMKDVGVVATRNFYGVLRIKEEATSDPQRQGRYMFHGRIAHGFQFRAEDKRHIPTMYFDEQSGLGITLRHFPRTGPLRIGVIGLGAGTIAAYGELGDSIRFYEINPEVYRLAREQFTFLEDCRGDVEVILGDARLSLEREPTQQFDVFVLDAFSGDAIPAHLLTKEAFDIYLRHLKRGGVVAANISNRHVDLAPVLARLAEHYHMESLSFLIDKDEERFRSPSDWFVMSRNRQFMDNPIVRTSAVSQLGRYAWIPMWTDQYNNLFRVLK
jgi:hypothetical protein